ncbi:nicotinamide-nucleotide amidohydrolase family protein [Methylobacillus gramineus]|uniref:CinA family protein n=1 Tax=Methylobacillus gramineus TaxID=755169 RepID=UPI001CFFC35C|nr:nicotinamide-nucleotide amidohydrolase family protein [Methylobacillus gramineus]MCB5185124.1 nicotinamide-nucleotide amidohydrolase family protein [Methylobacillus gramineus]
MASDALLLALSTELGIALKEKHWQLALAESCTGGWAAQCITAVAGSSSWFDRGFVSYSNAAKEEMLDVRLTTLQTYGAVSEETAREMALGALQHSHAQLSASITGIAGPDGGSTQKPVGTVCFGWVHADGRIISSTHHFPGDREEVRRQSVKTVFEGLLQLTLAPDL